MNSKQLGILRHSLGLDADGRGKSYRNYFCTGPGSTDYPHCMALVEYGHMIRRNGNELTGFDDIFVVTDSGKAAARSDA